MCNCLDKIRKESMRMLTKKTGGKITDITFALANFQIIKNGKSTGAYRTAQEVFITYEHTKRNGDLILKSKRSFVEHLFCPFCGKSYDK